MWSNATENPVIACIERSAVDYVFGGVKRIFQTINFNNELNKVQFFVLIISFPLTSPALFIVMNFIAETDELLFIYVT